ncbi:MAG: DUF2029 domain-containing protein [Lachnospiraceae bacterium]|nr:DUF2029 domain-containing protein [Lachnospiraceae bacterium]
MKDKLKDITPFGIFIFFVTGGFLLYLLFTCKSGSTVTDFFMMENTDLAFCDLKMHINFVSEPKQLYFSMPFAGAGCFPPLAYFIYYCFCRLLSWLGARPGRDMDIDEMSYTNLLVVYYSIFVAILILVAVCIWGKNMKRGLILFIALLLTTPFFAGGMSVANSTMPVMAALLIALRLKDAKEAWKREAALLLIAVCAGMKIYPAVFGLLYLREKRFKEAARLTVYGIVLFFCPFAAFGGLTGMMKWLDNVRETMGYCNFGRIQCIKELLYTLGSAAGIELPGLVLSIIPLLFLGLMIFLAATGKDKYRRVFFLCAVMAFYPTSAYRYTLCYLAIPFIMYFMEKEEERKLGPMLWLECVSFTLLYALPVLYGLLLGFRLNYDYYTLTYVEIWLYVWAYLLLILVTVHEFSERKRNRKAL